MEQMEHEYDHYLSGVQGGASLQQLLKDTGTNPSGFYRRKAIVELRRCCPEAFAEMGGRASTSSLLQRFTFAKAELDKPENADRMESLRAEGKVIGKGRRGRQRK